MLAWEQRDRATHLNREPKMPAHPTIRHDQDRLDEVTAENAASAARKEGVSRLAALARSGLAGLDMPTQQAEAWVQRTLDRHPEIRSVLAGAGYRYVTRRDLRVLTLAVFRRARRPESE